MATGRNIKGITIEIGGDTTGLQKALSGVNDKLKNTQAQLKDVNTLLKLDPSNTVLVAQKQELLKNAIADTANKLNTLEAAQKDVTAALEAGKIGQEEYMAFQREVEATKATLSRYQSELDGLNTEQDRLATNTERLSKLFDALGADVDDYADVLGSKLVTAIKNGSASSDSVNWTIMYATQAKHTFIFKMDSSIFHTNIIRWTYSYTFLALYTCSIINFKRTTVTHKCIKSPIRNT